MNVVLGEREMPRYDVGSKFVEISRQIFFIKFRQLSSFVKLSIYTKLVIFKSMNRVYFIICSLWGVCLSNCRSVYLKSTH